MDRPLFIGKIRRIRLAVRRDCKITSRFSPKKFWKTAMRSRWLLVFSALLISSIPVFAQEPDFARDVRPILAKNCFKCQGPDEKYKKAGLRPDVRDVAIESAGKPAESELIRRITSTDAKEIMPPPATKLSLTV